MVDAAAVGALLLAALEASAGHYVLIRRGRGKGAGRSVRWRVNVRRPGRPDLVVSSGQTVAEALARVVERLQEGGGP